MKVIDRYILREFLRNFIFSLIFFTILLLVVQFSEKEIGKFVSRQMSVWESLLSLFYQTPSFIVRVAPPSALFATFFSLGRMEQSNEITAMKASGISLYRVFIPVFIVAFLIAVFLIFFNDQVVTRGLEKDTEIKYSDTRVYRTASNLVFSSSGNRIIYVYLMYLRDRRMQNVTVYTMGSDNKVQKEIYARYANWSGTTWHLRNGVIRTFIGDSWNEQPFDNMEITVPEDPEIMVKGTRDIEEMSLVELSKLINYKKSAGGTVRKELVAFHHKISFPFACFIMAVLGAPLFIMFGKSGMAVGFLITMFVSFLYWGIAIAVFEAFGNNGKLPPAFSTWIANFIFAIVGIALVYKVKK
jgi:lipopolysaccharide export system permease protein